MKGSSSTGKKQENILLKTSTKSTLTNPLSLSLKDTKKKSLNETTKKPVIKSIIHY
jgi:hypothetical protein